jgi:hypothetical protein
MRMSVLLILLAGSMFAASCSKRNTASKTWDQSRDSAYLKKRFILLTSIEKSHWEGMSTTSRGVGPNAFEMRGFFQISLEESNKLEKEFEWSEVQELADVSFELDLDWPKPQKWFYSDEFNRNVKTGSWHGKVYFSPEHSVFYFNVGR